jgi:hypothetical protein
MQAYEIKNVFVTSSVLSVPSANAYTVFLPNYVKDVHRVELLYARYTSSSSYKDVYLDVEELRSPVFNMNATSAVASSSPPTSAFAVLGDMASGSFTSQKNYPVIVDYPFPLQKLDRLTVSWTDNKGLPLAFTGESSFMIRMYTLRRNMGPF